jgi:hypothetical protein
MAPLQLPQTHPQAHTVWLRAPTRERTTGVRQWLCCSMRTAINVHTGGAGNTQSRLAEGYLPKSGRKGELK